MKFVIEISELDDKIRTLTYISVCVTFHLIILSNNFSNTGTTNQGGSFVFLFLFSFGAKDLTPRNQRTKPHGMIKCKNFLAKCYAPQPNQTDCIWQNRRKKHNILRCFRFNLGIFIYEKCSSISQLVTHVNFCAHVIEGIQFIVYYAIRNRNNKLY